MGVFVITACVFFVFSILEAFVFGEKYARWWFRQLSEDYKDYDLKKFRLIRCATFGIIIILSLLWGFCDFMISDYIIAVSAVTALHYCIIRLFCKRKDKGHPGLYRKAFRINADEVRWIRPDLALKVGEECHYRVRIRYRQPLQDATLTMKEDALFIFFDKPQRSITPGQFAVWYAPDGEMIGSGVIQE